MEFLLDLDLPAYTTFLYIWGSCGILSAVLGLFFDWLPISSRKDNSKLAFLGTIDKKLGWIIMEIPILVVVLYFYLAGSEPLNVSVIFVAAFVLHYANRALIYPHRIRVQGKTMPVSIVLTTIIFYSVNGYLIGHYFGSLKSYPLSWLADPRFAIGLGLFLFGFFVNVTSDNRLIRLRGPGESDYKIPRGGWFQKVSCPNYFGEIVEWIGFAIMSWSLPGALYAAWVSLALISTGINTHRWYLDHFGEDYPQERKAVIPHLL